MKDCCIRILSYRIEKLVETVPVLPIFLVKAKMNKENRSAAGLRRSAIVERMKLREEWSALKEIDPQKRRPNVTNKKQTSVKAAPKKTVKAAKPNLNMSQGRLNRQSNTRQTSEALCGVVALVEVGSEARALPLRAALVALGASVMPQWSPLITHLVWAQGGCRSIRAKARALASTLVSPLWVEACAKANARLPESVFRAPARPSDLPSPRSLRTMLKKVEAENIPLVDLRDSEEKKKIPCVRISSETEQDTTDPSRDTSKDTSRDTSKDTSRDTSKDTSHDTSKETTIDIESRVNTAPRRALPVTPETLSPRPPPKSRRKLFTHKEVAMSDDEGTEDDNSQIRPIIPKPAKPVARKKLKPPVNRKEVARAERAAKRILAASSGAAPKPTTSQSVPLIVLTGMSRKERSEAKADILSLKGRVQKCVNKRTTHVILGSFKHTTDDDTGIAALSNSGPEELFRVVHRSEVVKARSLNALFGAARGCRVLSAQWIRDSKRNSKWLPHTGYEVPHLKKISQKARVERMALSKLHSEYAYDVFCGMRTNVSQSAEQRDAAIKLLNLCGAHVQNGENQNGGFKHGEGLTQIENLLGYTQKKTLQTQRSQHATVAQNGEIRYDLQNGGKSNEFDIKIGLENGDVSSKWVFDSVAAARMRTVRRYVINVANQTANDEVMQGLTNFCLDDC